MTYLEERGTPRGKQFPYQVQFSLPSRRDELSFPHRVKLKAVGINMTINERLKMLRIENGLAQTQLAQALNIGQTTVAAYEKEHDPNIYNLIAYARYFQRKKRRGKVRQS